MNQMTTPLPGPGQAETPSPGAGLLLVGLALTVFVVFVWGWGSDDALVHAVVAPVLGCAGLTALLAVFFFARSGCGADGGDGAS